MKFIEYKTFCEITHEFKEKLNNISKNDKSITGIFSGFEKLDAITKGFQPSNLILVGVNSGETSFVISLIRKIAIENKCPSAFFSLTMNSQQLMTRIICQQTNISTEKLRLGFLNESEIELVSTKTAANEKSPLYVYDYPFITISDIETTLLCSPPDFAKIIIIDSLQLISKNKKDKAGKILNRKELTKITFQLKKLAEKFNITILVLVHLNFQKKDLGKYYSRRPQLSDIRKYAPIDTYADLVLLLYRPEYYKIDEWDDEEQTSTTGEAEIIIAKNNYGILDNVRIQFKGSIGMFENLNPKL